MKKKVISLLLTATMLVTLTAGCGSQKSSAPAKETTKETAKDTSVSASSTEEKTEASACQPAADRGGADHRRAGGERDRLRRLL